MEELILPNALHARAIIPMRHRSEAESRGFHVMWTDGQVCEVRRDHLEGEHWKNGQAAILERRAARLRLLRAHR
jgi:hypothetical protein